MPCSLTAAQLSPSATGTQTPVPFVTTDPTRQAVYSVADERNAIRLSGVTTEDRNENCGRNARNAAAANAGQSSFGQNSFAVAYVKPITPNPSETETIRKNNHCPKTDSILNQRSGSDAR